MKKISLFIVCMLFVVGLFNLTVIYSVSAIDTVYSYGFESTTATHQVSSSESGFFYSYESIGSECEVTLSQHKFGSKSYQIGDGVGQDANMVKFNSTLGNGYYLVNSTLYFMVASGDAGSGSALGYFCYYDYSGTNIVAIYILNCGNVGKVDLAYKNSLGVNTIFVEDLLDDEFHKVGFEFLSNDSINYWCLEYDGTYTETGVVQVYNQVDNPQWNYTRLNVQSLMDTSGIWVDCFNVTVSDEAYSGSEEGDLSDYYKMCLSNAYPDCYHGVSAGIPSYQYIEGYCPLGITGSIHAVDLYVGIDQYNQVSGNPSSYYLYINGFNVGNADIITEGVYGGKILRWYGFSVGMSKNSYPVFEFKSTASTYYNGKTYYWYDVGVINDGVRRQHNTNSLYGDGVFNGNANTRSLDFCYYYTTTPIGCDYSDMVYGNDKGETTFYEWDNILFSYTISTLSPDSYIRLYKDGVRYNGSGFGGSGKFLDGCSGTFSLLPTSEFNGVWSCRIYRGGSNIYFFNFTIENRTNILDYNAILGSTPNPSDEGEEFTLYWEYNRTYYDNLNGCIVYSIGDNFYENYVVVRMGIKGDGSLKYKLNNKNVYYFYLCSIDDGILYPLFPHSHSVGVKLGNNIYVGSDSYIMEYDSLSKQTYALVNIFGNHGYLNGDVYVLINSGNDLSKYVGGDLDFDFYVKIYESGVYNVDLIRYNPTGNYTVLESVYFTVIDKDVTDIEEKSLWFGLDEGGRFVVAGVIVLFIFMVIGVGLAKRVSSDKAQGLLVGVWTVVGVVVNTIANLWPLYASFIVALIIVGLMFLALRK